MAQAMEIDAPKKEDLFKAAESGNASFIRNLSEDELRHALSLTNEDGRSLLHVAASAGRTEVVSFLAAASPSSGIVNSTDEDGWAPLHSATSCGNGEIVNILLENGELKMNKL
ncbi:hypothetical protein IEQ34_026374 [Dendrobium chrysotoxum]|uniref:Uncharacterized protein n=1 Tax=Dendrobium chrysotoxum TaxID=161865 RepID=A0AAV7FMD5_DENCH|nr:hypothetical protein IEQ34_026374 [Dendrobium chrysotoxum]